MLRSLKELRGYKVLATDGDIGDVDDLFFDDELWTIRYFVVDTWTWMPGRKALIVPSAVERPDWEARTLPVSVSREKVRGSPHIGAEKPVSRQAEEELHRHYKWVPYWAALGYGVAAAVSPRALAAETTGAEDEKDVMKGRTDPHLRSVKEVTGYRIQAADGEIGHVEEFIAEDADWHIRYLVIDTRNWLPGRKVLVTPSWIERVSWPEKKVFIDLPRELIKASPKYDPEAPVNRQYEERLYDYYGRPKYWK